MGEAGGQGITVSGNTYWLAPDTEGRLVSINGAATASYVYDAVGNQVRATVGGLTTTYISNYYEWNGAAGVKYYYACAERVAMRDAGNALYFLLADTRMATQLIIPTLRAIVQSADAKRARLKAAIQPRPRPRRTTMSKEHTLKLARMEAVQTARIIRTS